MKLKKGSVLKRCLLGGLSVAFLLGAFQACTPEQAPGLDGFEIQALPEGFVTDYLLKVEERFSIQAVDDRHQADVDKAVGSFEADLEAGILTDYYQNPDFSIKLAAGSEGSAFSSQEGIAALSQNGAVYAQAVVFNDGAEVAEVYKGQFNQGRFYFDNDAQNFISPDNITYLVALSPELETEVYKGQLSAGSEGSALSAGSEGSALTENPLPLTEGQLAENRLRYQKALEQYGLLDEDYTQNLEGLKFVPPYDPPRVFYTETFSRLVRAYEKEVRMELALMRGLPEALFFQKLNDMVTRFTQRWEAECGEPPPDFGGLYPQRLPEITAVPTGYQSAALDKVIEAIPEFKAILDEQLKLRPPERWQVEGYQETLARYQASHPEVFEEAGWRDDFAPPDCVKGRDLPEFRVPGGARAPGIEDDGDDRPPPPPPPK